MAPTEGRVATLPGLNGGGAATRYPQLNRAMKHHSKTCCLLHRHYIELLCLKAENTADCRMPQNTAAHIERPHIKM